MILFIFLISNLITYNEEVLDFGHKHKTHFNFSKKEIVELNMIGKNNDIVRAANLLGEHLPKKIVVIFNNAKECIDSNPIYNMNIFSEHTKYSAFDDLIRFCILTEYNKLVENNLTNDEVSMLMFEWVDDISINVFYLNHNQKSLADSYLDVGACDKKINYHLVISSLLILIEIKNFDSIEFLNYLIYIPDNDEMCESYRNVLMEKK